LLDQLFDSTGNIFDRDLRIDTMLVKQIDAIGLQPFERSLGNFHDVLGPAINADLFAVRVNLEPEFGRDNDLIANGCKRFTDDVLVGERTINFGCVKERDAAFDGASNDSDRFRLAQRFAISSAQAHAAKPKR
jgi:hypothetical protein